MKRELLREAERRMRPIYGDSWRTIHELPFSKKPIIERYFLMGIPITPNNSHLPLMIESGHLPYPDAYTPQDSKRDYRRLRKIATFKTT